MPFVPWFEHKDLNVRPNAYVSLTVVAFNGDGTYHRPQSTRVMLEIVAAVPHAATKASVLETEWLPCKPSFSAKISDHDTLLALGSQRSHFPHSAYCSIWPASCIQTVHPQQLHYNPQLFGSSAFDCYHISSMLHSFTARTSTSTFPLCHSFSVNVAEGFLHFTLLQHCFFPGKGFAHTILFLVQLHESCFFFIFFELLRFLLMFLFLLICSGFKGRTLFLCR